jgi:uncharacterized protein (TIGR00251 family)
VIGAARRGHASVRPALSPNRFRTEFMIQPTPGGVILTVRVIPRSAKSEIAGLRAGALLVRLQAPPVDGAANDALIDVLAHALDIPRRAVTLLSGEHGRTKRVRVLGLDVARASSRLPGIS